MSESAAAAMFNQYGFYDAKRQGMKTFMPPPPLSFPHPPLSGADCF